MTSSDSAEATRKRRHRNERIAAAILVCVAAAATGGVLWWHQQQLEELRSNKTYIPRVEKITPEILLLQEYVRIDTSTAAGAATGARWLHAQLAKRGIRAEIFASGPDRLNVYARIRGRRSGQGLLLFNHIDVVAPGEGWSTPPFSGSVSLNMMWGRGTLDMKAMAVCQLLAFADVAQRGRRPEHDLVFLATAEEEAGSRLGMQWILANRPDVVAGIGYGITEGGITEVLSERMTYFGIEVGGKQLTQVTLEAPDLASMRSARIALEPFFFAREPHRLLPAVRQYFRDIAGTRLAYRHLLSDAAGAIARGQFWSLPAPYRDLTQDSVLVNAPVREGNRWTMTVRLVNLPDTIPDDRLLWLREVVEPHGAHIAEVRVKEGPVPFSPFDTPLFALMAEEARRRYHVPAGVQVLYRSTTDSRFLRPRGIVCYGVSPYPVDLYQSLSIHHVDERIRLDHFMAGVGYMKSVVNQWIEAS